MKKSPNCKSDKSKSSKILTKYDRITDSFKKKNTYQWLKLTIQYCDISKLWYYIFTNMVRAPLEALLTLYLIEACIIFTPLLTSQVSSYETIYMIFLPFVFAIVICFVYTLAASIAIGVWIYNMIQKHLPKDSSSLNEIEEAYLLVDRKFGLLMGIIHVVGAICYGALAFLTASSFTKEPFLANYINNSTMFIQCISILGLIAGCLWNVYGYYSDRRIDLSKFFRCFRNVNVKKSKRIRVWKLRYYKNAIVAQLVCIATIISSICYILYSIDPCLFEGSDKITDLISYSTFLTFFITIFTLYSRQMLYLLFLRKYLHSDIFPNLLELSAPQPLE